MVYFQTEGFNGPFYWKWTYADASILPFLGLVSLGGAGIFGAQRLFSADRPKTGLALIVLVVVQIFLSFSFLALTEDSFETLENRVKHPDITSYYTEARKIEHPLEWLDGYHLRLRSMVGHTQTHPPGPILYYFLWLAVMGEGGAALWGGLFLPLLGGIAIPALYRFAVGITQSRQAGFSAAVVWTLLPAVVLMVGSFDAVYPLFTILLLHTWTQAVWEGRRGMAAAFGVTLTIALLFTHSFLVLGCCLLLAPFFAVVFGAERRKAWLNFLISSAIALLTAGTLLGLLYAAFGYDHYAALRGSMAIQQELAQVWGRPYHYTVFWDVYDFFLASGWLALGVLAAFLIRWRSGLVEKSFRLPAFAAAGLLGLLVVDLTGLLRAETARVWLFLQPLVIPLVGVELSAWRGPWRYYAWAVMLLILAVMRSRLHFI